MSQQPAPTSNAQMYVWWSLVNLFLAVTAIGVTLWAFMHERSLRADIIKIGQSCPQRVITSATPPIVDDAVEAPPQDQAKSGYIGRSGASIVPAMRVELEALRADRPDGPPERVRLGSQQVLPSRTIHVVNLWATWCTPCLEELPDFKAMFARHADDWGDRVRFVPIQVKDGAAPDAAYRGKEMPPAPYMLADRGLNDPLVSVLTADEKRALFKGNLPVTLILDCNRRVRWAQFDQLQQAHFKQLEGYIDRFLEELDDTSPGSWCTQEWPGNGRCEGSENTAKGHSFEDCGELKKTTGGGDSNSGAPTDPLAPVDPLVPPPAVVECPEGSEILPDGRCKPKLRGTRAAAPKRLILATCGNGKCDGREDSENCCEDCGCEAPQICKQLGTAPKRCVFGLQTK